MFIERQLDFNASREEVWRLLTDPALTKQYMYGCEVITDWKPQSPILWNATDENGKVTTHVKGVIKESIDREKIRFTMIDPNSDIPDIPENYVELTYELSTTDTGTSVLLTHGDFSKVENGKSRYELSAQGWDMVVPLMIQLLA